MPKGKRKAWRSGKRNSRRISKTERRPYGLARDQRGRHHHKDAVRFYDQFCKPRWEDRLRPPKFEITRQELELFAEERGALPRLPKRPEPSEADLRLYTSKLCAFRIRLNDAALHGPNMSKAGIDWAFCIEPLVAGCIYEVMIAEARSLSGKEASRVSSFAEAQQKNNRKVHQGIMERNHSIQELDAFDRNFEIVDDQMKSTQADADETRLKQFALEEALRRKRIGIA